MAEIVFDIEANGLLDTVTEIHCISFTFVTDYDICPAGQTISFNCLQGLEPAYELLEKLGPEDVLIGHNILDYDIPAIKKVRGKLNLKCKIRDTIILTRLVWPDIKHQDFLMKEKMEALGKDFPSDVIGRHSLKAWGIRIGEHKGEYEGGWEEYNEEMEDYNRQDTVTNAKLWKIIKEQNPSEESIIISHRFFMLVKKQINYGFHFNKEKAKKLYFDLSQRRNELAVELRKIFPTIFIDGGEFTPKRDNKNRGYAKGATFCKIVEQEFNPDSTQQIADRLIKKYNWQPEEWTDGGEHGEPQPKVTEEILEQLDYPEAPLLKEYLMLSMRIGQVAEGNAGWLKLETNGRIHGNVVINGTNTFRCRHSAPNVSQATAIKKDFGKELRECWTSNPEPGWVQFGVDLSGIEARLLGAFLEPFDNGKFIKKVLEGDIHTDNLNALQKHFPKLDRDKSKTIFYAAVYGAGDSKLGFETTGKWSIPSGKKVRQALYEGIEGLEELIKSISNKRIICFDGRKAVVRSVRSKLNAKMQANGSVVFQHWLVLVDEIMSKRGYPFKGNYEEKYWALMLNSHDEAQITCREEIVPILVEVTKQALKEVEKKFKIKCPLDLEYKVGKDWAECH